MYNLSLNELKEKQQWINWKYNENKGKVPYDYRGNPIGTSNKYKNNWCDYKTANEAINIHNFNGIGVLLKNGLCGIDIDHKDINDNMVQDIINLMDTYTEFSPSGKGFHLLFTVDVTKLPTIIDESGSKKLDNKYYQKNSIIDVECYISNLTNRYLTYTGISINNKPINERTQELLIFLDKYMLKSNIQKEKTTDNGHIQEIISKVLNSSSAEKFKRLFYTGDITEYNNDDSRADLALCGIVARFTKDFHLIEAIMTQSKLCRKKWIERPDYRKMTIEEALTGSNNAIIESSDHTINELECITARELQEKELKPITYYVEKILPQGLTILCSAPKTGKSWMALDMCISICNGRQFLKYNTKKAGCLYLALEDSQNRLKERMNKLLNGENAPLNLLYSIECDKLQGTLIHQLELILKKKPQIKVIVIDTLQKIRGESKSNNIYANDYNDLSEIKKFADKNELCIVVIHHTKKGGFITDIFEKVLGTNGITGTADTTWIINKQKRFEDETTLSVVGRDVELNEYIVNFDKDLCKWQMISTVEENEKQKEKDSYYNNTLVKVIKKLITENNGSWTGSIKSMNSKHEEMWDKEYEKSPQKFRKKLDNISSALWEYDKIKYIPPNNPINGERLHTFKKT